MIIGLFLRQEDGCGSEYEFPWEIAAKKAGKLVIIQSVSWDSFSLEYLHEVVQEAKFAND